jgi:hypothetical protein
MKLAFIADGRSEHTRRWIQYFVVDCEVLLISPYECNPIHGVTIVTLPGRFRLTSQLIDDKTVKRTQISALSKLFMLAVGSAVANRLWGLLKLTDLFRQIKITKDTLRNFEPDVVHALRIQTEGYLAAFSRFDNFVISSWGSDFIHTAANSLVHRVLTKMTMKKTMYFMSDCQRDQKLAGKLGLPNHARRFVFPGNGGVNTSIFFPSNILCTTPTIFYCRGLNHLTKIDTLFTGMSLLKLKTGVEPSLTILSPHSTHAAIMECALRCGFNLDNLAIIGYIDLAKFADIMRKNTIFVSPLISDGVPCSMMEAMACGMIPVMSDLDSIREQITNGVNGFLFDPISPQSLAAALEQAFASIDGNFRLGNVHMISEKSEYYSCLGQVKDVYSDVTNINRALRK